MYENKGMHYWKISGKVAAGICMTMYSLMSPRRQKQIADTLYAWRQHTNIVVSYRRPNGQYTKGHNGRMFTRVRR